MKKLLLTIIYFFLSCNNGGTNFMHLDSLKLKLAVQKIQHKRIYFGHQSVGKNIVQGIRDLLSENNLYLNLITLGSDSLLNIPEYFFVDGRVGQNNFPITKCEDFEKKIREVFQGKIDVAILKFCYVDIKEHSDVEKIFSQYVKWVEKFKNTFPEIQFVHMTIPLMASSGGWKIHIKRLIGYPDYTDPANIKRNYFNELLLKRFKEDPIFDIAKFEATYFNSKLNTFKSKGKIYYSLIREYTYDGGHLNELGRQWIAYNLLIYLGEIL